MYAIVQQGGHQYRLAPGDRLLVDRMAAEVGSMITLEPVLLLGDAGGSASGLEAAKGARVAAVVVGHRLGRKLRVFKYKPKKRYRRTHGHRSRLTELRVEALLTAGQPLPTLPAPVEAAPAAAEKAPKPKRTRAPKAAAPAAAEPETPVVEAEPAADDEAGDAGFEEV
ncbi:MAG TPA: 50S ribosomal protein L21 [Candidatus Dormibacteraeota bacterium]|jgi:large subunit ribosomal protein L21|nr:50S ribosomal protein L21 [Candidatus Dormibacteraeota bacterium]